MKVLIFLILCMNIYCETLNSKSQMMNLIKEIKTRGVKNKILITQNGVDIYFENNKLNKDYLKTVSGVSQESLIFGVGGENKKTPKDEKNYLLKRLLEIKENNKEVFSVNYASTLKNKKYIKKEMNKYGFVGEAVPTYSANIIFNPLEKSSDKNIKSLKEVKNFLYLLNPNRFSSLEEYYETLKYTDYDMLIIEPSYNGKFFTKKQIEQLKIRKNGKKRLVIAYFSIGEAEDYRDYWNKKWNKNLPNWIVKENPNWKGNYIVKYWSKPWKEIIKNYQNKLNKINVDGYYLDTVDTYEYFEQGGNNEK